MRRKEIEDLPIRSIEDSLGEKRMSKFEIDILKSDQPNEGLKVDAHRHDYYHILYVKNGQGEHTIDFKSYEIKANSIFFVSPGQVHALEIDPSVEGYVVSFNADFYHFHDNIQKLMDYPFFHSISNAPMLQLDNSNANIQAVLDDMNVEYLTAEKGKEALLRALLEVLLIRAARMYHQTDSDKAPNHLTFQLRTLEALIDAHFKTSKLLNNYAEMIHISPKHLNSLCKKGLNKTVSNLIHERTLIEAKRLLLFTDQSITEIAFELGFSDKSYFMRFFKKQTNLTADAFRNQ